MDPKFIYSDYFKKPPFNFPIYGFIFNSDKILIKNIGEKYEIPYFFSNFIIEEIGIEWKIENYIIDAFDFGSIEESHCIAVDLTQLSQNQIPLLRDHIFIDLRRLGTNIDWNFWQIAATAYEIIHWNRNSRYCGKCGNLTDFSQNEYAKVCTNCKRTDYPRLSPALIVAVFNEDKILLAHNFRFPDNLHSILAGFVNPGENLEEAVSREIKEETGISVKNIKYFGSQPWPFPNSLMLGFTAEYSAGELKPDGQEIKTIGWFDSKNMPAIPSKLSISRKMIDSYLNKWKN